MTDKEKKGKAVTQKSEYLENEKSFLDEIKSNFYNYVRATIWLKKKKRKIADTSFKVAMTASLAHALVSLLLIYNRHLPTQLNKVSHKTQVLPCAQILALN